MADNPDRPGASSSSPSLSRRDLIKKALALGGAAYAAPMIIGSVTPVSAQGISGAGCTNVAEACEDESALCNLEVSQTDCGCLETVENDPVCVFLDCPNDQNEGTQTENCDGSDDCPTDWVCVDIGDLGCSCEEGELTRICMAPCVLTITDQVSGFNSSGTRRSNWPPLGALS